MSVEDVFQQWLGIVPFWQEGLPPEDFQNFVFRYDGPTQSNHHIVTLVDSGILNTVSQPLRQPTSGPRVFMTCSKEDPLNIGHYYSTRGARFQDALRLLEHSPVRATVQLTARPAQCRNLSELLLVWDRGHWLRKLAGKSMKCAVENGYRVALAFSQNHKTPVFHVDVANCSWLPREAVDVACASPPCPAFSSLKGFPGFTDSAALPWSDLLVYLRHTQPPLALLENPSAIAKKRHQVRLFMKSAGYRLVTATDEPWTNLRHFIEIGGSRFGRDAQTHRCHSRKAHTHGYQKGFSTRSSRLHAWPTQTFL